MKFKGKIKQTKWAETTNYWLEIDDRQKDCALQVARKTGRDPNISDMRTTTKLAHPSDINWAAARAVWLSKVKPGFFSHPIGYSGYKL